MSKRLVRFQKPPAELSKNIEYSPFEIWFGVLDVQGNKTLVAIWRRMGTEAVFEPTSAEFVRTVVHPRLDDQGVAVPVDDGELDDILSGLVAA